MFIIFEIYQRELTSKFDIVMSSEANRMHLDLSFL